MLTPAMEAVVDACRILHQDTWSIDSIAATLNAEQRWEAMPQPFVATVTIDTHGALMALSHVMRGTDIVTMLRARLLVEIISTRQAALELPRIEAIDTNLWRFRPQRRPMWAATTLLVVSAEDVTEIASGEMTIRDVAHRRDVPRFMVEARMAQEIAYGWREGDQVAALCQLVNFGPPCLRLFDRVHGEGITA